jgi:hypothetical protein
MAETVEVVETNPKTAYEPSDWPMWAVGASLFGIFVFLVIAPFVLMWVYSSSVSDVGRKLTIAPPGPRLQVDPEADLNRFRAEEERRLDTYYWVDKQKGIVHIPIAQAMRDLARKGIAGFPGEPQ